MAQMIGFPAKLMGVLFIAFVLAVTEILHAGPEQSAVDDITKTEGVVTTDSGLRYLDVKVGEGPAPEQGRLVTVHFTGWVLEDGKRGTKFDSSVDRGMPAPFTFKEEFYMRGWYEGISTMRVGGKRTLIIAPEVYGTEWAPPPEIAPAGSTLIFDIELLKTGL